MRLTKRYIIFSLNNLQLSNPIRYERYYINENLRIQKKNNQFEKENLANNIVINKEIITAKEFNAYRKNATNYIIRDSYLYLKDNRISIKKYYQKYSPLIRVEVTFETEEEMRNYQKENWMGMEITNTPLAFDKDLSNLTRKEFLKEIKKY